MSLRGERAALPGLEIHHLRAFPRNVALSVMIDNPLAAFAQHRKRDTEAAIGRLRARYRLKKQVDGRASIKSRKLRADVREAAALRGDFVGIHQPVERAKNRFRCFH
jgi:hypothetical protein